MLPRRFASSLTGLLLAALTSPLAFAQEASPASSTALIETIRPATPLPSLADLIAANIRQVMDKSAPAICRVEAEDEHGRLVGSGFLVDSDGTLITSYSLGEASEELVVTVGKEKYPARRLLADAQSGISLVKIDADEPLPFLPAGQASKLGLGTPVLALGYPLELPLSPSFGVVAGFDAGFQGRYFAARHVRVNAVIQRGESGAPLLNLNGEVVGVLISPVEGNSGLFALPMEAAQKIVHDYRVHQRIRRGWLGADVRVTDAPEHGSNARLRAVRPEGPGAKAGLRPGDVLLQVGAWKITNPEDVLNASFYMTAEEPIEIRISRAGKEHTYTVITSDPPEGEVQRISRGEEGSGGLTGNLQLGN